jgi:predicted N-formylglutamate amidohydrolase
MTATFSTRSQCAGSPGRGINPGLVVTCEHGGNRIPAAYRDYFRAHGALPDTHLGYDPGALEMARALARAFRAPLVSATVSRLLVDLNRSIGHPQLHFETIYRAPPPVRLSILEQYYTPFRSEAERLIRCSIAEHGQVLHLSSHSFARRSTAVSECGCRPALRPGPAGRGRPVRALEGCAQGVRAEPHGAPQLSL